MCKTECSSTELVKLATTRRRDERDKARVRIAFWNVIPSSVMRNLDDARLYGAVKYLLSRKTIVPRNRGSLYTAKTGLIIGLITSVIHVPACLIFMLMYSVASPVGPSRLRNVPIAVIERNHAHGSLMRPTRFPETLDDAHVRSLAFVPETMPTSTPRLRCQLKGKSLTKTSPG